MEKISIITAVHNGLAINKIFVEYLEKYTVNPYELIVIDNCSTDGSLEFFKSKGSIVIENKENYSYPFCQNQGIKVAKCDFLFFLNNDIIVSPDWDKNLIETALQNGLDALSASGFENMGSFKLTDALSKKWKRIKYPFSLIGFNVRTLRFMFFLMYNNWEKFCDSLFVKYKYRVIEGIVGDNVMMTKDAIAKMGLWDERIQVADWDFFMRSKQRSITVGDMKPCHIALGVYIHHFGKMTLKYGTKKPVSFADKANIIKLSDKWSVEEIDSYNPNNEKLTRGN
jgi:GT2 family glycosyltransferase